MKPGSRWELLAHREDGPVDVSSASEGCHGSIFDELIVDHWFHLEQMDVDTWWLAVYRQDGSEVVLDITVGEDGRASHVSIREDA